VPTPAKGPRMGGSPAHERLMLANLAAALFEHGRITTTESKAKRLRPYAERLVTFGKRGDLHARRQVLKVIRDKSVVHTLFAEIGPRYQSRPGGYTRITKIGPRKGDNAPMAVIELVEALTVAQSAVGEAERARGTRTAPRRAPTGATRESAEALATQSATAASVAAQTPIVDAPLADPDASDTTDSTDTTDTTDTTDSTEDTAGAETAAEQQLEAAEQDLVVAEQEVTQARVNLAEVEEEAQSDQEAQSEAGGRRGGQDGGGSPTRPEGEQ